MHGDHTPLALSSRSKLTALGAYQMYDQGMAFRNRYLQPSSHDGYVGIVGIQAEIIDNSQLNVESSTDECSAASAIAFMDGLYPPSPHATCDLDISSHNRDANSSNVDYSLCGNQYPNIRTISPGHDPDSIWYVVICPSTAPSLTSSIQEPWP
jgi:hypothetical protein